ncbi:class I SAM-dependent methyltransferase [Microtetraspora sp. NBRC 16547]|uniref:methyltransferase domain-containing protein n=1 Tax=Microtetraspora sp. NBRC 16547 TaxID=3030993 RepID=UPI0024A3FB4D|nr:class I SAM-dependent methyltransferase [Microtetraspora sp. NBRC 16547]GLW99710.1 hypothetical protein Misp02_37970 [Microtetraspora sp. NBRC 16547]
MQTPLGIGNTSSAYGERGIVKRLTALRAQHKPKGERLLDVGCGDGSYTVRLAEGFTKVDGVDIESVRLKMFAERIEGTDLAERITIREMSASELDFPDDTFDLVTAIEVVEHVHELDRALKEIHRVLKPGGLFQLTTPNRWFPLETHGVLFRGRRYRSTRAPFLTWVRPLHRRMADARTFTGAEIRGHLTRAGLRTRRLDYIGPPFDLMAGVGRFVRPVTDWMEGTPLRFLGMALVVTAEKPVPAVQTARTPSENAGR